LKSIAAPRRGESIKSRFLSGFAIEAQNSSMGLLRFYAFSPGFAEDAQNLPHTVLRTFAYFSGFAKGAQNFLPWVLSAIERGRRLRCGRVRAAKARSASDVLTCHNLRQPRPAAATARGHFQAL
jgi:hypothetical protein